MTPPKCLIPLLPNRWLAAIRLQHVPTVPPVHFTAHPKLTRIAQIWAGTCRWKPRATLLKKIAARLRAHNGFTTRDRRMYSREHAIFTLGFDSVRWRDFRKIRATSPYVTQTIYRLKCNRLPLRNRLANNLSCLNPSCSPRDYAPASHVF